MDLWQIWLIAGVALWLLEIVTATFVVGAIGTACFVVVPVAAFGASFNNQLFVLVVATIVLFLVFQKFARKRVRSPEMESNADALIGMQGVVIEDIDTHAGAGRVKLGGEDWRATTLDGSNIGRESKVIVRRIEGNKVVVELV